MRQIHFLFLFLQQTSHLENFFLGCIYLFVGFVKASGASFEWRKRSSFFTVSCFVKLLSRWMFVKESGQMVGRKRVSLANWTTNSRTWRLWEGAKEDSFLFKVSNLLLPCQHNALAPSFFFLFQLFQLVNNVVKLFFPCFISYLRLLLFILFFLLTIISFQSHNFFYVEWLSENLVVSSLKCYC